MPATSCRKGLDGWPDTTRHNPWWGKGSFAPCSPIAARLQKGARTLTEDARSIVEMLASHELALKQLYQTYTQRFPSFKDFWLQLAADEQRHANWLGSLLATIGPSNPLAPCGWPKPPAMDPARE